MSLKHYVPFNASNLVVSLPIPVFAPVTITVLPTNGIFSVFSSGLKPVPPSQSLFKGYKIIKLSLFFYFILINFFIYTCIYKKRTDMQYCINLTSNEIFPLAKVGLLPLNVCGKNLCIDIIWQN